MAGTSTFSPDPALYEDPTGRADRVCRFLARLRLWEGRFAGQPFTLAPFQQALIRRIYGPTAPDGGRLVRQACIWIPRGNAKTTLAAGLALAHLLGPESEPGGQIVCAAADRENAGIAFNSAWQMVRQDPALLSRVRPIESRKILHHDKSASKLSAISTEAYSKHGLNVSFFLADEVHSWPASEARKLFGVVRDSMVKREHPLTIVISTAGEGEGTLAADLWEYSLAVARGEIEDPTFAPIIFAADPGDDFKDPETWRKANPAIDAGFLSVEEIRLKVKRAEFIPRDVADIKRYHLNIWQNGAAEPWIDPAVYDAAPDRTPLENLESTPAFLGIDMAAVTDMASVAVCWPDGAGGYDIDVTGFFPSDNIQARGERDQADYMRMVKAGCLRLTEGNVIDQNVIFEHVLELAERFQVQEIACDRWGSVGFMTRLQDAGLTVAPFGQGFASMAGPVNEMERAILSGGFRHGGNLALRSAVGNVALEQDPAGNRKFTKARARGRVDSAVAAVMALARAQAGGGAGLVYNDAALRPDGFLTVDLGW
ncbi:terminase large subunit [Pararhodospirillum oryzae]|uniref:Terminase n=1 Tax=Pararhodospirillum oryzae TaxID=478448 RepID=A0A512HAW9_9PROT|nr:terminase TerL endonuclease subunit [Pararhodospirillum oryzae]GEO82607.1 terminase [Pararhodospirillum oryzae]